MLARKSKNRNKEKSLIELVELRRKNLSDKTCLNIWKAENARWGGVGLSIRSGNKTIKDSGTGSSGKKDNKTVWILKQKTKKIEIMNKWEI